MKKVLTILLIFLLSKIVMAQDSAWHRLTAYDYIQLYKDAAIADMKQSGVPASITLAQGLFESDFGNSILAKQANNHFGIKCHKEWKGETFHQDDDIENECFRKYKSVQDSYDDHSQFLRTRDRYKFLFELEITDYKAWAQGLKKAGYATNPVYAERLIKFIEAFNLSQYDQLYKNPNAQIAPLNNTTAVETIPTATNAYAPTTIAGVSLPEAITYNDLKAARVRRGDTWYKIAKEHELELHDLLKYNDAASNEILKPGDIVYLQSKRKCGQAEIHMVQKGETYRTISQAHGIRLKKLFKLNGLSTTSSISVGDKLKLR